MLKVVEVLPGAGWLSHWIFNGAEKCRMSSRNCVVFYSLGRMLYFKKGGNGEKCHFHFICIESIIAVFKTNAVFIIRIAII